MKRYQTFILLVLATTFWGANFNVGKYAVEHMGPIAVAAWRFGLAAVGMLALLLARQKIAWPSIKENLLTYVVMGAVGVFGFNACFFFGLKLTTPINGSLIMALNPMLTVLLSALILGEKITPRQIFGLSMSFAGVLIVVSNGSLASLIKLGISVGDLVIFVGNLCWALYAVIGKRFLKKSTPLQTTTFSMIAGALMLAALAGVRGEAVSLSSQLPGVVAAVVFMAFAGSILAYLWWNNAIAELGAARTAVFFDLVPITTMLISISFGARVEPMQLIGSSLVLVGVAFSSGIGARKPVVAAAKATA